MQRFVVAQRQVVLYSNEEDRQRLTGMLETMNYRPILGGPERGRGAAASMGAPIAIVSDTVEAPLDLCRDLAACGPVLLISNEADFAFRIAAARVGVAALVRRPVNALEIADWLAHFADQQSSDPVSILVVDDDGLVAELNAEVLRSAGMLVQTVCDPAKALQAIEDMMPDLVLMDMQMPGVDGVDLARAVRQARQFASLPIMFLSSERDERRQLVARRFGGDDFLVKPVLPEKLISLVRLRAERSKILRSLIERDRLTGLDNPTRFNEKLSHELERCRRTGVELALVAIDVDWFKRVNDTYGHPTGDSVLRTLAGLLRAGLRMIDVVGRCGGEEFGVMLLDTGVAPAAAAIDRLRERFGRIAFEAEGAPFNVTFSAGVASSRACGNRMTELVAAADEALYRAKRDGRDRVRIAEAPARRKATALACRQGFASHTSGP